MKFLGITLFEKDSVDKYEGVLVPLATAQRHPTVEAEYARRHSEEGERSEGSDQPTAVKDDEAKAGQSTANREWNGTYTIEGLREEVMDDVGAGGHDSAYDC